MKITILGVCLSLLSLSAIAQLQSIDTKVIQFLHSLQKEKALDSVNCFAVKFKISKIETVEYFKVFYESTNGYDSITNYSLLKEYTISDFYEMMDTKKKILPETTLMGMFVTKDVDIVGNPGSQLQFSGNRLKKILQLFAFAFDPASVILKPVIVFVGTPSH